jgi:hypothetical protein
VIPENLQNIPRVTTGENRLFRLLQQKLPDDCYVWFNIPLRRRHADFIILDPHQGLLVLEVKDWQLDQIEALNPTHITLKTEQGSKRLEHPLRQARNYTLSLLDTLARDPLLISPTGDHQGRLRFPFGYAVVWTRIKQSDFRQQLPELFEPAQMLFRDDLTLNIEPAEFSRKLHRLIPSRFDFQLSPNQIDRIRYHIFPEIRLPQKYPANVEEKRSEQLSPDQQLLLAEPDSETILTVMDLEQERLAKNLGEGHRLLRGVAGSGKTWTLVCRARILAQLYPDWHLLVLCYNVSLATLLKQMIESIELPRQQARISVLNFHQFLLQLAKQARLPRTNSSDWAEQLSSKLSELIERGKWQPPSYQAILIDEAHDFPDEWLQLIVKCLNPQTNSLFIVHDSAQNIYRKGFSFKRVGIQIKGRTRVLRTNYRNTREIAELASCFLNVGIEFTDTTLPRDDEGQLLEIIRPQTTLRTGPKPLLIECKNYREECAETAARVKRWLERHEYPPQEILILYVKRGPSANDDRYIDTLLLSLAEAGVDYEWIARDQESKRNYSLASAKVKVSTIHSAKGLDFAAVAMVGISMLPSGPERADIERKLVYVGLTRARNALLITYCKESQFIQEIKQCLADR